MIPWFNISCLQTVRRGRHLELTGLQNLHGIQSWWKKGWGTLCTKEHFTQRNILLLKSWTHLASQHTWQSHNLLHSTLCSLTPFATQNPLLLITPCSLTPFATQNPLLLITPCSSTLFASQHPLLPGALYYSAHFALCTDIEIIPFIYLNKHFMNKVDKNYFLPLQMKSFRPKYSRKQSVPGCKVG